jgi:hypothetical protein
MPAAKPDHFLADAIKAKTPRVSYTEGFRFGFGFFVAGLLVSIILGGLSWGAYTLMHLH